MVSKVHTVALAGFDGAIVEVETDSKQGLPAMSVVGMGSRAIDEARERVRSAIRNSLLTFPPQKLTVNLAPAELPKEGTSFDLPIALSVLIASGQLKQTEVQDTVFVGELALDGGLRPINGAIVIAETAQRYGFKKLCVPELNGPQAALIDSIEVFSFKTMKDLYLHLKGERLIAPSHAPSLPETTAVISPTLDDIHGQEQAKRAIEIAVAGRHNILLYGPPGAGKSMLAKTITSLLPPLSLPEKLSITKLHSLVGGADGLIASVRPFRAPHHSASPLSVIGGGSKPRPGEISLAHLGVLFMDEIPEYQRTVLESLRQPLEDKTISITRAHSRVTYPADFMLVATMNPCPCGFYGDPNKACSCSSAQILNYQKRLSGPLLDRIDLIIRVSKVDQNKLLMLNSLNKKQHSKVLERISIANKQQRNRYKSSTIYNSSLTSKEVKNLLTLTPEAKSLLQVAATRLDLSARSYFKVIKVAQTIADLAGSSLIKATHMSEALQFRGSSPT